MHDSNPHVINSDFWKNQTNHFYAYTLWKLEKGFSDDIIFLRQHVIYTLPWHQIIIDIHFLAGMIELEINTYLNEENLQKTIIHDYLFCQELITHLGKHINQ